MSRRRITGIGWDHPRGYDCLVASQHAFAREQSDIEVVWDKRSLKDFGEAPIEPLAERYDLIVFDHPFVGTARETGCLVDLSTIVPGAVEAALADEVGKSARSYHFGGAVYGLPTDAAAQVAAYRPDLLAELGAEVPRTHAEVLDVARRARAAGRWMALAAGPTDAICMVISYAANLTGGSGDALFQDDATLRTVLDLLAELVALAHPQSTARNPIATLNAMAEADEIVYVPLAFGYSNYARAGREPLLLAADFAGPGPDPAAGALLGGAGCAVTKSCRDVDAAARYLSFLHRPEVMATTYFEAGGQPGSRAAWLDEAVNAASNDYFSSTLRTLDSAYLRPRFHGFVPFFEAAGEAVNAFLKGEAAHEATVAAIRDGYAKAREGRTVDA